MRAVTKEQFLKQVKPYASQKMKQAYIDGYRRGYWEASNGKPNRHSLDNDEPTASEGDEHEATDGSN
jgi:hypothetical protein